MKKILILQPLKDMHFDTRFGNFGEHLTSKTTIWTLSLIGLFILIMASINFVNLSTAQATQRSKEVGIRKVLGSSRKQLIFQVFGETGIIVLFSLVMAALLAKLALPFLNNVASSIPENTHLLTLGSVLFLLMVAVVVTFLSGFYPAMVLSGFKPALALKSRISMEKVKGISLRRILVITQFAISQVLIIGTIVAVSQMNFIRKADLGFNKESILVTPNNTDSISLLHMDALKQELQKLSGVQSVTMMFDAPSTGNNWESNFNYDHSDKDPGFNVSIKQADADYFKTFGLQFIAGNAYQQSDTLKEMVVNETLLKKLQVKKPQDAIGKTIKMGNRWIPITGVVRDFKTSSLREQTRPLVIVTRKKYYSRIGIKIHSANFSQTVAAIKSLWEKTYPDYVYTPEFMDESIAKFYKQESQMEILYKIFAALAILISCLGLYGLVSFMAQQKTKEIGVRKVLGASVSSIVYLFSKEFTLLILIAFAIALPVAYFLMNSWLVNFAYRIDLGIGIFLMAILASILLAWMTVGYKAIKAALANPVKSLRSE
jgi:ABC-type antimicrobial peptide transport system permease subunit